MSSDKRKLFDLGIARIVAWCSLNQIDYPTVVESDRTREFGTCAYYRDGVITICVDACAGFGHAGRQWSWPGYVVDRTPFGVLAHELGHHVDRQHGPAGGYRSHVWRPLDARPLTGYCPNDNEWFAELFRLFVTNPNLLHALRPQLWPQFCGEWASVETRPWRKVLCEAERQIRAAENKIANLTRTEAR